MAAPRSCLICTAPAQHAHFGVHTCRSCADFFKRTAVAGREFSCRQGERKCSIYSNDRHNCRGCRFQKCMALGMKLDAKRNSENDHVETDEVSCATGSGTSKERCCLICSAPSKYAHFGINACRSCAEFFMRTVQSGRMFTCRQGKQNCTINPRDRHNCRGCRFRKCKTLGMKWDSKSAEILPEIAATCDTTEIPVNTELRLSGMKSGETDKKLQASIFIDHTIVMCFFRMSGEKKYASGPSKQADNLELYQASYSTMIPIHCLLNEAILEFGNFAFESFKNLNLAEKKSLIERRLTCLDLLESIYRTCHHFPDCKEVRMPGYTTYFTNGDVEKVFESCDDDVDKPKLMREWRVAVRQLSRMVRHHFEILGPTDYEFVALLGLAFWADEYADEKLDRAATEIRSEIVKELRTYYEEQGIVDYARRLGHLFCLLTNCQECSVKVDED